jgi:hypothetical protein
MDRQPAGLFDLPAAGGEAFDLVLEYAAAVHRVIARGGAVLALFFPVQDLWRKARPTL